MHEDVLERHGNRPFDSILNRTPYLVLPKLAIVSMPQEWQIRLAELLDEAEDAGIETPEYFVFRDVTHGNPDNIRGCKNVGRWDSPFHRLTGGFRNDPWADYRHGNIAALCPKFRKGE